jgi:hypothetical protein
MEPRPSSATGVARHASVSGLGLGNGRVSLVLTVAIACLVAYLAITRRDVQPGAGPGRWRELS